MKSTPHGIPIHQIDYQCIFGIAADLLIIANYTTSNWKNVFILLIAVLVLCILMAVKRLANTHYYFFSNTFCFSFAPTVLLFQPNSGTIEVIFFLSTNAMLALNLDWTWFWRCTVMGSLTAWLVNSLIGGFVIPGSFASIFMGTYFLCTYCLFFHRTDLFEHQEKLTWFKSRSGSIAHEVNGPISNLQMGANILEEKILELMAIAHESQSHAKSAQMADIETKAMRFLDTLKRNLSTLKIGTDLILAQVRQDNRAHTTEVWDAMECIEEAIAEYPMPENIRRTVHIDNGVTFNITGYKESLKLILYNFLKNSLFSIKRHGHGEIYIHCEQSAKWNVISFKDTASGISAEMLSAIFEPFFSTGDLSGSNGVGLGLDYCKNTIEQLGGYIDCQSEPDKYIQFTLSFPRHL